MWSRVQSILATALDTAVPLRPALLDRLCAGDARLRAEVDALLACEHGLPEELPAGLFSILADDASPSARIGERAGAFEIESCLGEGGSSVVYAARRVSDFQQRVAIKLLRAHVGASVARRFGMERETLARLNHPHIGKLYDAGMLSDATPYLVLELVPGRDWAQWLSADRPPLRVRIGKFLDVCSAVEYAHQQLLVHRDIKPTNLMIDGDGRAVLLDFGIAKLLDDSQSATLTREGGFALTPAYAAPEQLRGEPVSTATDVYALGLVLYETLTGSRPFAVGTGVAQRLQDPTLTPRRPSQLPAAASGVPADALRGDLDNIVMKALEPEPHRRYASVAALASDLRAFLEGRPVAARAAIWRYVAGKFIRRHPLGTGLTVAAVLAVVLAFAVALQETWRAQRHLAEARALAHDILIEYPEEISQLPGSLPVQERMVRDAMRYLDSLRAVAGNDAALSHELAEGYLRIGDLQGNPNQANLGDVAGAESSYQQSAVALAQWQRLTPGAAGIDVLQARLRSRVALLDHQQSRLDQAAAEFRDALARFDALAPEQLDAATLLEHARTLDYYGDLLGNTAQASLLDVEAGARNRAAARQLLTDATLRFPEDAALAHGLATTIEREGDDAFAARDLDRAMAAYRDAIARVEALLVVAPTRTAFRREYAGLHSRLSLALDLSGDLDGAIGAATQSVAIIESLLAADPTDDQMRQGAGAGLGVLAKMLIRAGRYTEAGPIVDRQIAVNQRRVDASRGNGEMVLALSLGYRRRGEQKAGLGEFDAAIAAHEQALRLQSEIAAENADNESHRALTLLHLGRIERQRGNPDAAVARLGEAISAMDALVTAYADVPVYREDLIDALEALGDTLAEPDRARPHFLRAVALIDGFAENGELAPAYAQRREALVAKAEPGAN